MILVNPEIDVSVKMKYNYMNIINLSISKNEIVLEFTEILNF